jgi:hypothetical protein
MPLFGRALLETGTQTESFVQLLQRIGRTPAASAPPRSLSRARNSGEQLPGCSCAAKP